jgi:plasmid stabilization system protein ParE
MKVYVSSLAKQQVRAIAQYIKDEFGVVCKNDFLQEVRHIRELIGINPYIGPIEKSLSDLPVEYHSFVVARKNKIVYAITEKYVKVVAFWDCRRNPDTLVSEINHLV